MKNFKENTYIMSKALIPLLGFNMFGFLFLNVAYYGISYYLYGFKDNLGISFLKARDNLEYILEMSFKYNFSLMITAMICMFLCLHYKLSLEKLNLIFSQENEFKLKNILVIIVLEILVFLFIYCNLENKYFLFPFYSYYLNICLLIPLYFLLKRICLLGEIKKLKKKKYGL